MDDDDQIIRHRKREVPIWERALLTLNEAADYTGIGINKLRTLSDEPGCDFVIWIGCKRMFKRKKLDEFLDENYSL